METIINYLNEQHKNRTLSLKKNLAKFGFIVIGNEEPIVGLQSVGKITVSSIYAMGNA